MYKFIKLAVAICVVFTNAVNLFAQDRPTWKGSVVTAPGKQISHPDGSVDIVSETLATLELSPEEGTSWSIQYNAGSNSGACSDLNTSQKPLTLEFKNLIIDSAIIITGTILPDSSVINCTFTKGDFVSHIILKKVPPPVFWSGDITYNNGKILIRVTYLSDQNWEVFLQGDSIGSSTIDGFNEAELPKVSFSLASQFDTASSNRRLEGTMSADSSVISGKFFITDSVSFPLTLYKGKKNIEQHAAVVYASALYWWAGAWIIFAIILFLVFVLRKKANANLAGNIMTPSDDEWLKKILPVVRVSCKKIFFGKRKILVIHNDSLFILYANKNASLDMLHDANKEIITDRLQGIKSIAPIPLASIKKILVEKESRLGKVRFHICFNNEQKTFVLPGYEMPNVLKALQSIIGNRLQMFQSITFHDFGAWIQLFVFSFAAIYIYTNFLISGMGLITILYFILFIMVLLRIVYLLFASIPWVMDHIPRKFNPEKSVQVKADLSHRKPFRSVALAIFLKITGAVVLTITFLFIKQKYLPPSLQQYLLFFGSYFAVIIGIGGYFITGLLLNLSLAFANHNPKAGTLKDTRPPILYLRSFLDDRETTFQPGTWLSNFLGVDPPYYQLSKYMFIPEAKLYRLRKKIAKYLYNNHPVRMLRLLFGWPVDTSEQQLELYFRKKGPLVAIGRPGERIITSGAGRMYVTNEEWQNVILDYLHKSQLVVLQPSSTEGIWWEISQSLNLVQPNRFFLCMINYKGHQNFYEDFRLRIEGLKAEIILPRFIGNAKEICFFRFDENWKPELLRLSYKNFVRWPFEGNAADLNKSLGV